MTATEICNLALGYLASGPVTSASTDTSTAGKLCAAFYLGAKRKLLASRNWTFAKQYWSVTPAVTAPTHPKWQGSYAVPAGCLRVHRVDDGNGTYDIEWERVGDLIYTDTEVATLYVEGVGTDTVAPYTGDEAKFSDAFSFALAAELAAQICIPLTENSTLWSGMIKLAEVNAREAAGSDGSQGRSEAVRSRWSLLQRR